MGSNQQTALLALKEAREAKAAIAALVAELGVLADGSAADGDLVVRTGGAWVSLAAGLATQVITSDGSAPSYQPGGGGGGPSPAASVVDTATFSNATTTFAVAISVVVPADGDYLVIFEGDTRGAPTTPDLLIAIGLDGGLVEIGDSEREWGAADNEDRGLTTTAALPGLTAGQVVDGMLRRMSGAGTVDIDNRRISIWQVVL